MMRRGWSHYVDRLRDDLWQNHKQIHIVDFEFYNMTIFNRNGKSSEVFVFEAFIDMLLHISLHKNGWRELGLVTFLSSHYNLDGIKSKTVGAGSMEPPALLQIWRSKRPTPMSHTNRSCGDRERTCRRLRASWWEESFPMAASRL